jgi:hypothetical protein
MSRYVIGILIYHRYKPIDVSVLVKGYKEPSIISGTGATIWSKTNSGPTSHHHPRSSPFP